MTAPKKEDLYEIGYLAGITEALSICAEVGTVADVRRGLLAVVAAAQRQDHARREAGGASVKYAPPLRALR